MDVGTRTSGRLHRMAHWRPYGLLPAGLGHRRRASDLFGLVVALLGIVGLVVWVRHGPTLDRDIASWINDVFEPWQSIATFVAYAAYAVLLALIVVPAIALRRYRVLGALLAAAVTTVTAVLLSHWLLGADSGRPPAATTPGTNTDLPLLRMALGVTLLTVAVPYLTRPAKRTVQVVVVAGVVAMMIGGNAYPLAALAAALFGWAAADAVRLAMGTPAGVRTPEMIAECLDELGVDVTEVAPSTEIVWGATHYRVTTSTEALDVAVLSRDAADAQFLARLWRSAIYRDPGPEVTLTRRQQMEHGASMHLWADRLDVPAPPLVALGVAGPAQDALLVTRRPTGRTIAELSAQGTPLADGALERAWAAVGRAQAERLYLGLTEDTVVFDTGGQPSFTQVGTGAIDAGPLRLGRDVAALLTATARVAGSQRAVEAMVRSLPRERVIDALPMLQVGILDDRGRKERKVDKALIDELRTATATELDIEAPAAAPLTRVSMSTILMAAGTLLGFWLLAGQLADAGGFSAFVRNLMNAEWEWVLLVWVFALSTNIGNAWAISGAVDTRLPFGPLVTLQVSNSFTGLIAGTVGLTAAIARFFQQLGLPIAIAVTSGVLSSVAGATVQATMFLLALLSPGFELNFDSLSNAGGALRLFVVIVFVVALAAAIAMFVPRVRRRVLGVVRPQASQVWGNLRVVLTKPRKVVALFGGNFSAQLLFALALWCAVQAYGGSANLVTLIVINTIASFVGGLAPVPGGMGAIEAGLIAGLTAAGVPPETAVPAVFTQRMFTAYLAPLWGYPALLWLRRNSYL